MNLNEKFDVTPKKILRLINKIKELEINLSDIEENISRGGGRGGQKINKTSNRVQLSHTPTGISVVCQRERERNKNRFLALRDLVDKIEMNLFPDRSSRLKKIEKIRRQKDRRARRRLK